MHYHPLCQRSLISVLSAYLQKMQPLCQSEIFQAHIVIPLISKDVLLRL
jgi:hypothetical protein